jgi:protein-disulfide isomerase
MPAQLPLSSHAAAVAAPGSPSQGRIISTHQGAFQFNLNDVPLLGSPDAPYVIVSLFDYTCHHCHIMHAHLQTALQYFSNRLAIISLPMPLDSTCNPLIRRTHPTASNACVYARLGLAVWRANRERFRQFDDFMFSRPQPPPVSEASDFAANLVGANALGRALMDPWIDEKLRTSISLYHTNYLVTGQGSMPQLVLGNKAVAGNLNSPGELIRLLNEHLIRQ